VQGRSVVVVTPLPRSTDVRTRDLVVLKIERQQTWANSGLPSIAAPLASPVDDLVAGADVRVIDVIAFHDLELDVALFELRRGGAKVRMEPQAFDVLTHLINNRDRVVPKEELMDAVWGGRFVGESAVTSRIKQARRAVGDDGQAQRVIQTVHGRGYRFIADVANVVAA
jgi:DNA-binding winged helix-turn-helix (wHTH) protein